MTSVQRHISGESLRFGAHVPVSTLRSDARLSSQTAPLYAGHSEADI